MTTTTEFYQALKKFSNDELSAKTIADYMEERQQNNFNQLKEVFMTKTDNTAIIDRIDKAKNDLTSQIVSLRADINGNLWKLLAALTAVLGICTAILRS